MAISFYSARKRPFIKRNSLFTIRKCVLLIVYILVFESDIGVLDGYKARVMRSFIEGDHSLINSSRGQEKGIWGQGHQKCFANYSIQTFGKRENVSFTNEARGSIDIRARL